MSKYIIYDTRTLKALYGVKNKTLMFKTFDLADEVAKQFFEDSSYYQIICITF